jgi:hypothetical protein
MISLLQGASYRLLLAELGLVEADGGSKDHWGRKALNAAVQLGLCWAAGALHVRMGKRKMVRALALHGGQPQREVERLRGIIMAGHQTRFAFACIRLHAPPASGNADGCELTLLSCCKQTSRSRLSCLKKGPVRPTVIYSTGPPVRNRLLPI